MSDQELLSLWHALHAVCYHNDTAETRLLRAIKGILRKHRGDTMTFTGEQIDLLTRTYHEAYEAVYLPKPATVEEQCDAHHEAEQAGIRAVAEAVAEPLHARIAELEPDAARLDILEKLMLQWPQVGLRIGDDAALFGCNRGYEPDESEYVGATLREVIDNAQSPANTGRVKH